MYHWIDYPAPERETEVVLTRQPQVSKMLAEKVVAAVNRLRQMDLAKPPGVAETIDWARTLEFLGETTLTPQGADDTLGAVVKERDHLDLVRSQLEDVVGGP
jgi:MoxR-like ATPase